MTVAGFKWRIVQKKPTTNGKSLRSPLFNVLSPLQIPAFMEPRVAKWEELGDKLFRKYMYGSQGMIAMFKMDKGAKVPIHYHPNEQRTYILKGSVKVTMEGGKII